MAKDVWTRDQLIMALNVYCKIPFKDVKEWHPVIQKYAPLIGRTPVALKMKVGNFGRFDPILKAKGVVGLSNGSKAEEPVWNEFWGNSEKLAYESEKLFAERAGKTIEEYAAIDTLNIPLGKEREVIIRQRVNQNFFRNAVLTAYLNQCCITGISNTILLEACHISGWADDENNRTNPRNGLCMNPLFHRAYDKYLLAITPDCTIRISEQMFSATKDETFLSYLKAIQGRCIIMPEKFSPDKELLALHYEKYQKLLADTMIKAKTNDKFTIDNRISANLYYPILNIIREESKKYEYKPNKEQNIVVIDEDGNEYARISMDKFM